VLNAIVLEVIDMDRVIIYGTYHFLGFSLCEKLLDEGIQVCGFRLSEGISEDFLEEKKLLIGRNANFEEKMVGSEAVTFMEDALKSDMIIVISFYDIYYSIDEYPFLILEKILMNINKQYSDVPSVKVIILFPTDFIDIPEAVNRQFYHLKENEFRIQKIYIPTVFGPWQPSVFLFQQYLLKEFLNAEPKLDKRETTSDAIFIKDIIDLIIKLIKSNEMNDYLIQSNSGGQWFKGAEHLKLKLDTNKQAINDLTVDDTVNIIKLKESISIIDGLEQQKRHLSRLFQS
jgi:hypothetical protein